MKKTTMKLKLLSTSLVIAMLFGQTAFVNANNTPTESTSISSESIQSSESTTTPEPLALGLSLGEQQDVTTSLQEETLPTEPITESTTIPETSPTTTAADATEPLATTVAPVISSPTTEPTQATETSPTSAATTIEEPTKETSSTTTIDKAAEEKIAKDAEAKKLADEVQAKKLADEEAAKLAEAQLYEFVPMGVMPANGYPVDQNSLILSTQFNGTSINGQSTFDSVGQLWTFGGFVYISVLTNMGTDTLYIGPNNNNISQVGRDELAALAPLLIDHDNNPATAPLVYPVGGTSGSVKKEHWSIFRYSLSDFLGIMQQSTSNAFLLTLVVGQGHWVRGVVTITLPTVTANLRKTWQGGPMTPVTINLYRKIEGGPEYRYDTVTLSATNGTATKTWTNLAYTNTAGQVWIYRIDEADPGQGYDVQATYAYDSATHTYTFTLVNVYNLTPKDFVINGKKTIDTRPIASGETFTMQLYRSDANGTQGALWSETTTNADGSFNFPAITFEVAGTYYGLIKEVAGTNPGMTYDTEGKLVQINVTDNQDGTLSITMNPAAGPVIENKYAAEPTSVTLHFKKNLSGKSLKDGEFSFSLYRATDVSGTITGDALQTTTNSEDGTVSFTLNYEDGEEGLYYYTIKENIPTPPLGGVTYSNQILVYPVYVYDDNLGQLQSYVIDPQDPTFYNEYHAKEVDVSIKAKKNLLGRTLKAGEFSFQLLDEAGTVIRTATNAANGDIVFMPALTFTDKNLNSGSNVDTYTFRVKEVVPTPPLGGVTYDTAEKTLTVRITDNGTGQLIGEIIGDAIFNNSYTTAPLAVDLPVTKTLQGRTGTNVTDIFSFTLNDANQYDVSFTGNDTKTFNYKLNFTHADLAGQSSKTFDYTIKELVPTPAIPGIVYDANLSRVVRVTVTDNGDGTLRASLTGTAAFTNRYEPAPTQLTISGDKTLAGRTGSFSDVFKFQLNGADTQILTFTENGNKTFSFATKNYTFADLGGASEKVFTYTLTELSTYIQDGTTLHPIPGIIYDPNLSRTITVTLKDNGDGTLSATLGGDSRSFTNTYKANDTSVTIKGSKTLVGRTGTFSDVFRFELDDADTQALTFTANGNQAFSFTPKSYTFADLAGQNSKTFTYKVTEINDAIEGMTYDANLERTVTVTLKDNGDGTMTATAGSSPAFVNSYGAAPAVTQIPFSKTVIGRLGSFTDTFNFKLSPQTAGDPNAEQNTDIIMIANGKQDDLFAPLTYTQLDLDGAASKDFVYHVTEIAATNLGYTYDPQVAEITVTVSDDGQGALQATLAGTADFTNTYTAKPTSFVIEGTKTLSGHTGIIDNTFSFTLDGINQQNLNFTENGSKSFTFDEITFSHDDMNGLSSRTLTFNVAELATPAIPGIIYDALLTKQVTVTITDDGNGQLKAVVNSKPAFANRYEAKPTSLALEFTKELTGRTGNFNDVFSFTLSNSGETTPLETVSMNFAANGTQDGAFAPLSYTFADLEGQNSKTFEYEIAELLPTPSIPGIVYDNNLVRTVIVTLKDNGDGTLSTTQDVSPSFANTYTTQPIEFPITISKHLSGRSGTFSDVFNFVFRQMDGDTVISQEEKALTFIANGTQTLSFTTVEFTLADLEGANSKTFYYEMEEIIPTPAIPGMKYDNSPIRSISITVTDNGDGTLSHHVDVEIPAADGLICEFKNAYETAPTTVTLKGTKQLLGRTGFFSDEYIFMLDDIQTRALFFNQNDTKNFSFDPITYTMADLEGANTKVFTYTISEVGFPAIPGIIYDENSSQTISVTLTDNGDGTMTAVADKDALFINEYKADPVKISLKGTKTLIGRTGEFNDNFMFTLNGEQIETVTFTENGTQSFSFPELTFTLEDLEGASSKVFEFQIAEQVAPDITEIAGITYDPNPVRTVKVTLVDNGNGTLSVQADSEPSFTNIYGTDTAAATIGLKKILSGRTGSFSDRFAFTLDGAYERELIFTANGEQSLNFPPLVYTLDDLEGESSKTFSYKVTEINDAIPGIIYDPNAEQTVTVTVSDDGEGNLIAVVGELPVFENRYEASPTSITLSGKKTLVGRNGQFSDTFTFTLDAADAQELNFTENGTQSFSFPAKEYTFADLEGQSSKLFTYSIAEVKGQAVPGMVYDPQLVRQVTVLLQDNGDGTLSAIASEMPSFTNRYTVQANSWTPIAHKQLTGLKALAANDFHFEVLENGQVVSRGANDANGNIKFSPIPYEAKDLGTHKYIVREVKAALAGTTYDEKTYEVKVVVSDKGDGTMLIEASYPANGITFVNQFKPIAALHDPPVEKKVEGANAPADAVFSFKMIAITPNAPMPVGAVNGEMTRSITGAGSFEFGEMQFVAPGTYVYELRELPTEAKNFITDVTLYTITIVITSENGILHKQVTYTTNNGTSPVNAIVFTNKYEAPPEPTPTTKPTSKPSPIPRTGEQTQNIILYVLGLVAAAFVLIFWKRKRSTK